MFLEPETPSMNVKHLLACCKHRPSAGVYNYYYYNKFYKCICWFILELIRFSREAAGDPMTASRRRESASRRSHAVLFTRTDIRTSEHQSVTDDSPVLFRSVFILFFFLSKIDPSTNRENDGKRPSVKRDIAGGDRLATGT